MKCNDKLKKYIVCKKCGEIIELDSDNTFWDETGYGYSTKLTKCDKCNTYNVIKYEFDSWLKKPFNLAERHESEDYLDEYLF